MGLFRRTGTDFGRVRTAEVGTMEEAFHNFVVGNGDYQRTQHIDDLRATEYPLLDTAGATYVDYTGASLFSRRQLVEHQQFLTENLLGNPHSVNPTSGLATTFVEQARNDVLDFFNADPVEYSVIFTPNASGALRLVGEAFPFTNDSAFLLAFDNHNSVNGIREFARRKTAAIRYAPLNDSELRIDEPTLMRMLDDRPSDASLFAYPAQSNFSGVQHPLRFIDEAQQRGWTILLDCAAFVPTNPLDLSVVKPDFVPVSFYKMFGYPTGLGCLLARNAALQMLERPWFSGGTIWAVSIQGDAHYLAEGTEAFEDGTLNFLGIPAVSTGLSYLSSVGVGSIHSRVDALTGWLLEQLLCLRHENGGEVVRVYGPADTIERGATIAFNFIDPKGRVIDERVVDRRAAKANVSLRTGCFCNPGTGEAAFGVTKQLLDDFGDVGPLTMDDYLSRLRLESAGTIRVSLGIVSNFADVYRVFEFAQSFVNDDSIDADLPARLHC